MLQLFWSLHWLPISRCIDYKILSLTISACMVLHRNVSKSWLVHMCRCRLHGQDRISDLVGMPTWNGLKPDPSKRLSRNCGLIFQRALGKLKALRTLNISWKPSWLQNPDFFSPPPFLPSLVSTMHHKDFFFFLMWSNCVAEQVDNDTECENTSFLVTRTYFHLTLFWLKSFWFCVNNNITAL